ncbi:double zinc ribbon and ankyrin repeat-containing protein 1 isoform X2 [Narcine bancroftii]|uniref:double zinc ribbon and ankyrin repeat-containing protein 1 isoform X2 n=1 Tax=Narcine bancroftii TaxID=1343680 RepID=UPI00383168EE
MTAGSIAVPHIIPLRVPLPGKAKHEIDTNTPIAMKSDTHDVDVYYTINGSKPQPLKKPSSSTFKYRKPFTLPAGKGTVKALAVSRDGRESSVVTKVFLVEYMQPSAVGVLEDNEENFFQDYKKELSRQETLERLSAPSVENGTVLNKESSLAWEEATQKNEELKIDGSNHKSYKSPLYLNSHLGTWASEREPHSHRSQETISMDLHSPKILSSPQVKRILRETDFLKCACCFAPRPSDPFARFCQDCGSPVLPVPGHRLLPPEGAQMGLCVECKTTIPLNTPTCIVCEAPVMPQLVPQASIHLQDKIICRSCGTGNPANIQHCVTCETKLSESPKPFLSGDHAVPLPNQEGKLLLCSKCGRINNTNARFCDWCGAKTTDLHNSAIWCPLTIPLPRLGLGANKEDQGTQTVGLFYPSCKMMEKKEMEIMSQQEKQQKMTSHHPLLKAISPGRGYWRMQLDHICAHLRSYAHNNAEFRALIGEPQMGKITSATVHEDGYELSLRLNFVLAGNKNILSGNMAKISESNYLSSVTEGRDLLYGSLTNLGSEHQSGTADTNKKPKQSRRKIEELVKKDRLPPEDQQLLKEVGPTGLGRISEVQQLLDEGADPNCSNTDERPALTVAVLNQHHEVVPVLVQKGADINQQSGHLNNTALHEAAEMGAQGVKCTAVLLGCNASIKKKNNKGLTAYDLAVKTSNDQLTSLFAAKMGQGMLDKFTKTKHVSLDVY